MEFQCQLSRYATGSSLPDIQSTALTDYAASRLSTRGQRSSSGTLRASWAPGRQQIAHEQTWYFRYGKECDAYLIMHC